MTKLNEIYKCNVCGNIVEMVHASDGELVCCGKPMEKRIENSEEEGAEKHKPIIESKTVKVGSVPHPMEEAHHIEWIESVENDNVCRVILKADDEPQAEFCSDVKNARAYCNIHGLWKNS